MTKILRILRIKGIYTNTTKAILIYVNIYYMGDLDVQKTLTRKSTGFKVYQPSILTKQHSTQTNRNDLPL